MDKKKNDIKLDKIFNDKNEKKKICRVETTRPRKR